MELMPSDVKFRMDLTKLTALTKELSQNMVAKVGILGDKNKRDEPGLTNVEIGARHEFGVISENLPRRSFLMSPLGTLRKDELLKGLTAIVNNNIGHEGRIMVIFKQLGLLGERIVRKAFDTGGYGTWKPLTAYTIAKKGSSTILVDSAQLKRSITSKVEVQ